MQTGQYILHRQMVDIIREICAQRAIVFSSLSNGWLLELTKEGVTRRVLGYKFSLNDAVASSIAGDKVAAHVLLKRSGIPSVEHTLLRPPIADSQKQSLERWDTFVVKPLDGSGGHSVKRYSDAHKATEWIASTGHPAWAAAPFIDIVREIRLVLLDGRPLIVYEKQAVVIDGLKMFNLGLGATASDIVPDKALLALGAEAQSALGLRLSAVDIIETGAGERMVLEVNSGFMMENYIRISAEHRQRAAKAYAEIIDAVMEDNA